MAAGRGAVNSVSRQCNALAFPNAKVAVCPPITSVRSYVVVLHEVGHNRDRSSYGKLAREVFAWRWAREHALVWDEEAQNCMVDSLRSYLVNTELKDVLGVLEVERLISPTEYKRELARRWVAEGRR